MSSICVQRFSGELVEHHFNTICERLKKRVGERLNLFEREELRIFHLAVHTGWGAAVIRAEENIWLQTGAVLNGALTDKNQIVRDDSELFLGLAPGSLLGVSPSSI